MNRRQFVSRVSAGAAAAWAAGAARPAVAAPEGRLTVRFVGMMGFIERQDRSFLVATPGANALHHMAHTPFLMARAGSPIAAALGLSPMPGVIPAAFDTELATSRPADFVYRLLDNTALDIVSGTGPDVTNEATHLGQMFDIAPGKRLRGNIEKWALATVSLRGGRLVNSSAHPDAGKTWHFGAHKQPLTDSVNFHDAGAAATSIRLTSAAEARSYTAPAGRTTELWVFSAGVPASSIGEPTMLEHSAVLFDYMVDAAPIVATCPEATGRQVSPSEMPYTRPTSAGAGLVAGGGGFPGMTELCWMGGFLVGRPK